jgi:hypothetical protein
MNAGAINFLVMRFDEQPVLESDLPQIAAGVFQADDGHGGIAGDFARGVRAHACARLNVAHRQFPPLQGPVESIRGPTIVFAVIDVVSQLAAKETHQRS